MKHQGIHLCKGLLSWFQCWHAVSGFLSALHEL